MTTTPAYDYLRLLLEDEFYHTYIRFLNHGILHYELTNLLGLCAPLLEEFDEDDRFLRYEIIGTIATYLEENRHGFSNRKEAGR